MLSMRRCAALMTAALLILLAAPAAWADQDPLVGRIQATYESLTSFKANFTQRLTNKASGETETRKGVLHFKQPHLIRWETSTPEPELLVVGPKVIWDYFPDEDSAYKYPLSQILDSKTMVRFVSGQARLDQDFIVEPEGEEDGLVKLGMVPREPEPGLVQAWVWVEPDTALMRRILLLDFYGNENDVTVTDLVRNPDLKDALFTFAPPKRVEVFDNTLPDGLDQKDLSQ